MNGDTDAEKRAKNDRLGKRIAAGLVVLLVAGAIYGYVTDSPKSEQDYRGDSNEAVAQCEGFADKRLKAPATADYDLTASQSGESWTVVGVVDSENGFGANVRSDVRCVLHFEDDLAVLDDITIG